MSIAGRLAVLGLLIASLIIGATWLRSRWPEAKELSRKVVHIGCGCLLPLSWGLGLPQWIAMTAALTATAIVTINYRTHWFSLIEDVERKTYGTIFYCLSVCCLILFFWTSYPSAMLAGALIMAISDGSASLIGRFVPSAQWNLFGQTKSLAGTSTMLISSMIILYVIQRLMGDQLPSLNIIIIGILITALEQLSVNGIDNLSVPLSTACLYSVMIEWSQLP